MWKRIVSKWTRPECWLCVHDICSVSTKLSARTSPDCFAMSEDRACEEERIKGGVGKSDICQRNVIEGKCSLVLWTTLLRFMNLPKNFPASVWSFRRRKMRHQKLGTVELQVECNNPSFNLYFNSFNWNELFARLQLDFNYSYSNSN